MTCQKKCEVRKDRFKSKFPEMAPKATTQNQATKEAAVPAMTRCNIARKPQMKAEATAAAAGCRSAPCPLQCTPAKRASCPHPPTARRLDARHAASAAAATEEANTSRTVASREKNRSVSLSSGFFYFHFPNLMQAPLVD